MNKDYPTIELNESTDKIGVDVKCPECGNKYLYHVAYVNVSCGKCLTKYKSAFKQDIYRKKARDINAALAYNNGVNIKATGIDYESSIITIEKHFKLHKCWNVYPIDHTVETHKRCNKCGICHSCFTCKDCEKSFPKNPNKKTQACPHCHSKNVNWTYIKDIIRNGNQRLCPNCKSGNIVMTRTKNKTKCHICGKKDLSEPVEEQVFILTIEKKLGYR